ncbi:MAG TPA: hypothetical protein VIK72_13790 [Clostridiaceae bacterium]
MDSVVDQTADLTEFRTDTKKDLSKIIVEILEVRNPEIQRVRF